MDFALMIGVMSTAKGRKGLSLQNVSPDSGTIKNKF